MTRRRDSGQVAVETALMMPFTVFLILGTIKMSMMQQARLLTEYAAFRAARAGAIDQLACRKMLFAALEGILPAFGRTDDATTLGKSFLGVGTPQWGLPVANQTLAIGVDIVDIDYVVKHLQGAPQAPYTAQDFDDPNHPLTVVAQVTYNYALRIPFADYMIHQMWTGLEYFGGTVDALMPATNRHSNPDDLATKLKRMNAFKNDPGSVASKAAIVAAAKGMSAGGHRYFVPIRASYTMRMMSNLPAGVNVDQKQSCSGFPGKPN